MFNHSWYGFLYSFSYEKPSDDGIKVSALNHLITDWNESHFLMLLTQWFIEQSYLK